jgi:hypothetical protein
MRQENETNEIFSEEIMRLTTLAYPGVARAARDEYAAEAFLKGYKNGRISYDVLNTAPKTLAEALRKVRAAENNYKTVRGPQSKAKTRQVTWEDDEDDDDSCRRVIAPSNGPAGNASEMAKFSEVMAKFIETFSGLLGKMIGENVVRSETVPDRGRMRERTERQVESSPQRSPSPSSRNCFNCGRLGHMARDCPLPLKSPSTMDGPCFRCQEIGHIARNCPKVSITGNQQGSASSTVSRS